MTLASVAGLIGQQMEPTVRVLIDLSTQLCAAHTTSFYGATQREEMARQLDGVVRRALMEREAMVVGIGVVWEHDGVSGMLWWRADGGTVSRKDHVNNPASESFYDFAHMEWYERTALTERVVVVGPYVDAWGTDDHALTPALVVRQAGERIGVAALDLDAYRMTEALAGVLAPFGDDLLLVNSDDQVVASNRPGLTPGERIAPYLKARGAHVDESEPVMDVDGWSVLRLSGPEVEPA